MSYISDIINLFKDETKANILFIIDMFGPLNLQMIHKLLQMPKSTVLGHLREMVNENLIQLDSDATEKKTGKFYAITKQIKDLVDKDDENITLTKGSLKKLGLPIKEAVRRVANAQRTIGYQAYLISRLTAQHIENSIHIFEMLNKNPDDKLTEEQKMTVQSALGGIMGSIYELGIDSSEEFIDLKKIIDDFGEKLKKYTKSKRKHSKHTILMYLISSQKEQIGPHEKN